MRKFKMTQKEDVLKCPKCNNQFEFNAHSSQVGIDSCEVWVECGVCGFDPTNEHTLHRYEDTMGGTDNGNCLVAIECWNDAILEFYTPDATDN